MKKFKVITEVTYEHIIEIDDEIWNEQALEDWAKVFFDAGLKDHSENLARNDALYGSGFIEGYGYVARNGTPPLIAKIKDADVAKGINIVPLIYEDIDQEVVEIKEG